MNPGASPLSFDPTVGSYRLRRVIGEGDVATVHEATHLVLPRRAAVKLLRPEVVGSPQAAQRVLREGCVLDTFVHPGVPRALDCGILTDGRPWLALELVGGEPLSAMFARVGALPVDSVLDLAAGMLDIVATAHRTGIVHRALDPSHVMVGGGGSSGVRVIGWGLARQPGGAVDLGADRKADVYAVGALAYQAATGEPPFVAVPPVARVITQFHAPPPPVAALRPELPAELAALIDAMVDADATRRPTASQAAVALARLIRPYDELLLLAEGTEPGRDPSPLAAPPRATTPPPVAAADERSAADRDWEALMALAVVRRPRSGRAPRLERRDDSGPQARGR